MADEVGKTDWLATAWTVMAWVGLAGAPLALMGSMASCRVAQAHRVLPTELMRSGAVPYEEAIGQWFFRAVGLLILGLCAATAARFCRRLRQQN